MAKSPQLQAKLDELTALYGDYTCHESGDYEISYRFETPTQRIIVASDIFEYPLRSVRTVQKNHCDCTTQCDRAHGMDEWETSDVTMRNCPFRKGER